MLRTRRWPLALFVGLLVLAALACGGSFSTANITSARMTSDSEGTQETSVFTPSETFYCIVEVANAPEDTALRVVWTAVDVEGEEPNLELNVTDATVGEDEVFTFHLTNDSLWPAGQYKVDIYLNDELDRTLEFQVQ
jgi:hypothetical protein